MSATIQIRRATIEQLDELVPLFDGYRQFYQQASDRPGARRFLAERLLQGESIILLAYMAERAVGFTQLYPLFSSVSMERLWLLNDLFVQPDLRGQGVGEALLEQAAALSQAMGAKGLALETGVTNQGAQRLYERLGFAREEGSYHYFRPTR
ncbi:MAG TPA: GNAT family N-acetyltransferase [Symbiobacteriaceae bacterium]|nr:GNAT family N-acetyltransferase [Symbiobacteriaceae bacterium]